ncbi:MAG: flagellar hook-length control protein FliK [Deltaproteobacteria bacterium]|nr:flagellar hook-length control protein FliK [Deltaproteobacteria bacterium]
MDITPIAPLLEKDFAPQVDSKSQLGEKTGSTFSGVETLGPERDFEKVLGQTITTKKGEPASSADTKDPARSFESDDNLKPPSIQAEPYNLFQQSLELLNDFDALSENIFSNLVNGDNKVITSLPSAEYQPFPVEDETTTASTDFSFINQIFTALSNIVHGSFDHSPKVSETAIADTGQIDPELSSLVSGLGTRAGAKPNVMPFSDHRLDHLSYNFKLISSSGDSAPYKESFSVKAHYLSFYPASANGAVTADAASNSQIGPQEATQNQFGSQANSANSELENIPHTPQSTTLVASQKPPNSYLTAKFVSISLHTPAVKDFATAGRDQQQSSMLLDQLEKLVGQNNDKVDMTVSRTILDKQVFPGYLNQSLGAHPTVMSPNNDEVALLNSSSILPETIFRQNSESLQPALRQDIQAQYLNTKTAPADKQMENQSNTDKSQQDNSAAKQHASSSPLSPSAHSTSDAALTNNGFSAQVQGALQPLTETSAAAPMQSTPTPFMVQEDDVIQQLLQRFTLHSRLETSKMSLKLHPAELGKLKIDVVVKQDSLKANIFAQTQQAHDIIDKHLPRLKAILQEQGLEVDELVVFLESDSIENFDKQNSSLFQQQLTDFQQQHNRADTGITEQSFEETIETTGQETSSVNLTI